MFTKLKNIFTTATFKQSQITFTGTLINGVLGAVFYILTARYLGPASYGLLMIAITTLTLVADIGDLGTDTGLVNFVSKNIKKKPKKVNRFLKLGFEIKILVSFLVLIFGLLLAPSISRFLFNKSELELPLRIASIGVGTFLLFSFVTSVLQAFQKFWSWSLIQIATNALRLLLVIILFYFGISSVKSTLLIYILLPLTGFVIGISLIKPNFLKVKNEFNVAKEFFKYNKWVAAFTLITALSSRLDIFISARLLTSADVGIYSAANQLVMVVPQIISAIATVIAPKMAKMGSIESLKNYLKKTQIMVSVIAALGLLSIPIISYLMPFLYGNDYLASIPLFIILLFAMLIFLLSLPVHMAILYYFEKPRFFFYLSILRILVIYFLGWSLISRHGATGASVTVLVGNTLGLLIPAYWVINRISKHPENRNINL